MKINNTSTNITFDQLVECANENLSNKQKVKLAEKMSDYFGMVDMSYIEDLLVMAAKTRLKAIKKDKKLYYNNQQYFKALKIITKVKHTG